MWSLYSFLDLVIGAPLRALKVLPEPCPSLIFSIIVGIIFVYLYGLISPQQKIKDTKRKIWANIFEATLFQNDLKIAFSAYAKLFLQAFRYLSLAIVPIVVLLIPSLILLSFGYANLGVAPFSANENISVKARFSPAIDLKETKLIVNNPKAEEGVVRNLKSKELLAHVNSDNLKDLKISLQEKGVELGGLSVNLKTAPEAPTALRMGISIEDLLLGTNKFIRSPNNKLLSLEINYPEKEIFTLSWTLFVVIAILLSGYIFARIIKIEV